MNQVNFDEIIPREGTNSINYEGYEGWLIPAGETLPYEPDEIIRMWVADMDFAVPQAVIDALHARIDQRIFGYTGLFDPGYLDAFLNWCQEKYHWTVPREQIVTSPGIVPALFDLVDLMTLPGEKVLILTPSYAPFQKASQHHNREVICSPLQNVEGEFFMDWEDLRAKARDPRTSLCIFCNPHNPTGRVWQEEELKEFARLMREENMWVISDEIHCDLLRTGLRHIPLANVMGEYTRLVTCMAPSKTFNLAGFMISNLVIPDPQLREAWKKRSILGENPLSLTAAQSAWQHGQEWLEQLKAYLDDNFEFLKGFLDRHLPETRYRIPQATYLAWVDFSAYLSPDIESPQLFFAKEAGVILEDGSMFVGNGEGHVRLNLACPRSVLAEGLERIRQALLPVAVPMKD